MGVPRAPQNPLLGVAGHGQKVPAGPGRGSLHRAQGQHQLGSARLSQEKASSWGPRPPHQGTLASAAPLPPIP